jgi:hypothetical protein
MEEISSAEKRFFSPLYSTVLDHRKTSGKIRCYMHVRSYAHDVRHKMHEYQIVHMPSMSGLSSGPGTTVKGHSFTSFCTCDTPSCMASVAQQASTVLPACQMGAPYHQQQRKGGYLRVMVLAPDEPLGVVDGVSRIQCHLQHSKFAAGQTELGPCTASTIQARVLQYNSPATLCTGKMSDV